MEPRQGAPSTLPLAVGAAVLALAVPVAAPAAAAGAALDPTFSGDGKARVDFGRRATVEQANDVLVDWAGKVVSAGYVRTTEGTTFAVARLRGDGTRDKGFDGDGRVITGFRWSSIANRVVAKGEKIVVGGTAGDRFALARYLKNGRLDRSFGHDGKVVTDLSAGYDSVLDLHLGGDGSVTAAGVAGDRLAEVRYDAYGRLDQNFGVGGRVVTSQGFDGRVGAAVLQPDGKLLVAGSATAWSDGWRVARFDVDGKPDPAFGVDGSVTTVMPGQEDGATARAVTVQPDGRILVGGTVHQEGDYSDFAVARYLPDGSLDPTFDGDGRTSTEVGEYYADIEAVVVQPDGKIVAAGHKSFEQTCIAVVRYHTDGSLDETFAGDGIAKTAYGKGTRSGAYAAAVHDGRIVAAGSVRTDGRNPVGFAVTRYRAR